MRIPKCIACKRKMVFPGEGRFIDRSWTDDSMILRAFPRLLGKWVCSYMCYDKILRQASRTKK
jgi:hypothetical protein